MSDIFNSCVFVISRNEDVEEIEKLVVRNGGSVRKTFRIAVSKRKKVKRLFHVVSWLQEDDGRLAAASRAEAELITVQEKYNQLQSSSDRYHRQLDDATEENSRLEEVIRDLQDQLHVVVNH